MSQRTIFTCDHANVIERDGEIVIHGTEEGIYESRTIEAAAHAMAWKIIELTTQHAAEIEGLRAAAMKYLEADRVLGESRMRYIGSPSTEQLLDNNRVMGQAAEDKLSADLALRTLLTP